LGHDDLIELYKSATMFVLPCRVLENGDRDVIPNVIKEAMAVGIPVITTSIPAMEEIIDDNKSGLLAPPENPDLLSKSIEKLFNDKALRLRLSFAARKKIEDRFNINNTIGRLSDLLLSLNDNLASPSPVIALEHKKLQRGLSNAIQ
ncbi:MAG TPA: glycosyltransferase, partial [Yeosuana sp.]